MMRPLLAFVLVALAATVAANAGARATEAARAPYGLTSPDVARQAEESSPDGNDDTVAVQLTVLGIVLGAVFVAGTAAHLLRRRLGLTAYTSPKDTGHQ